MTNTANRESLAALDTMPSLHVREGLADAVYHALREAITNGSLSPGLRLREVSLAKQFAVSATPVREALRRLEREGLVEVSLHRGATVATFDLRTIADLYETREVLECRAVRRAAMAHAGNFAPVEAIMAETAVCAPTDDPAFHRLDIAFHRAVNEIGGNLQLAELAERVHRRIQGVRARCAVHLPGQSAISHGQHKAILAAVRAGDADGAERLTRIHIATVRDAVFGVLDQLPETRTAHKR